MKARKRTIIIVPNEDSKKKYLKEYPDLKVLTIPELWEADL